MDYSNLNFKHILVILNRKNLRLDLLKFIEVHELELQLRFVDSYFEAATIIQNEKAEPFNHIIMGFESQGQKFKDFVEHILEQDFYFDGFFLELEDSNSLNSISLGIPNE